MKNHGLVHCTEADTEGFIEPRLSHDDMECGFVGYGTV